MIKGTEAEPREFPGDLAELSQQADGEANLEGESSSQTSRAAASRSFNWAYARYRVAQSGIEGPNFYLETKFVNNLS